jgi:hypothetical protein
MRRLGWTELKEEGGRVEVWSEGEQAGEESTGKLKPRRSTQKGRCISSRRFILTTAR